MSCVNWALKTYSADDIVRMAIHAVKGSYIQKMTEIFGELEVHEIVDLRIHSVKPRHIEKARAEGRTIETAEDILDWRIGRR